MSERIYRILYCSQNCLGGSLDQQAVEIRKVLTTARTNNAARGITGALLFNAGYFAQVLEGPMSRVEEIFEKIQRDPRHTDVTILEAQHVTGRDFPDWSMAFAGSDPMESPELADLILNQVRENPSDAAGQVHDLLRTLVVQEDDYAMMA